jgi:hypothetical protein
MARLINQKVWLFRAVKYLTVSFVATSQTPITRETLLCSYLNIIELPLPVATLATIPRRNRVRTVETIVPRGLLFPAAK